MPINNYLHKRRIINKYASRSEFDGASNTFETDEVDKPPSSFHVTTTDIISLIYSIIVHIVDVGFDVNVAYSYYAAEKYVYFILTVCFMVIPAVIVTGVSLRMYSEEKDPKSVAKIPLYKKFACFFILLFQLAPVLRYYNSLKYALKARKAEKQYDHAMKKHYYKKMLSEDADVALLRVFECYLETAPQQILQVTMLLVDTNQGSRLHVLEQCGSIFSSLVSMAWSMAAYHRAIRFDQPNKNNITWTGTFFQVMWHLMVTVSRILSIAAVASLFPEWTSLALGLHWLAVTTWLALTNHTTFFSQSRLVEMLFYAIVGLVYVFNYFSIRDGPTKTNYFVFYTLSFCENLAAVLTWALLTSPEQRRTWFFYPLAVIPVVSFFLAMLSLLVYYKCFHPEKYSEEKNKHSELEVRREGELSDATPAR